MRSVACEKFAERKLSNALDSLHDVRANHETGWIEIELEEPEAKRGSDSAEDSERAEDRVDPAIAEAIRGALEADCGFELESLETTEPETGDEDTEG